MNVNYYASDAVAEMVAVGVKLYYITTGIIFYADRIKTYNPDLCGPDPQEGIDAMFMTFFILSIFAYGYRFLWGAINASIYYPLGKTDIPLVIHTFNSFYEHVNPERKNYDL